MTARRQFGAAIVACAAGAGLVLLALRQGWARVDYTAPKPLPSGSIPVSGQALLPAVSALALAAGSRACPDTGIDPEGSGFGAV